MLSALTPSERVHTCTELIKCKKQRTDVKLTKPSSTKVTLSCLLCWTLYKVNHPWFYVDQTTRARFILTVRSSMKVQNQLQPYIFPQRIRKHYFHLLQKLQNGIWVGGWLGSVTESYICKGRSRDTSFERSLNLNSFGKNCFQLLSFIYYPGF